MTPDVLIFAPAFYGQFGYDRPLHTLAHSASSWALCRWSEPPRGHRGQPRQCGSRTAAAPWSWCSPAATTTLIARPSTNTIDFNGRTGYVRTAIDAGVPIVPAVSIGAQETQLFLTRGNWLAEGWVWMRLHILPVSVGWPFGLSVFFPPNVPLPSKVVTEVLEPIDIAEQFGDDPDVDEVDAHVRAVMQAALDKLAAQASLPSTRLTGRLGRCHGGTDGGQLAGKPCGAADFSQPVDHRVGRLVNVVERQVVGQYRDVHLVDVTPHRHVEGAAGRQDPIE